MRILLVADYPDDPRLGSAKVSHKLREEFLALGHECDALYAGDLGSRPAGRQLRQLVAPILAGRAISRACAAKPYDVVDAASAEGLWFGVAKRGGARPRTALIARSHGLEHLNYRRMLDDARAGLVRKPWGRRLWYPASRLSQVAAAARVADRLIVLNAADRAFAIERGWQRADRIDLVPHGVSERFFPETSPGAARGGGALFCGAWDRVKGVPYLVEAWSILAARDEHIPLTVLGPGVPAERVRADFPEGARRLVTVIDRAPEDRVIAEYRRHDVLVFPSTYEGFGLVVLEAMSQGLPVIATGVGCTGELVVDGVTGLRVPPRDSAALASSVRRLMADVAARERMGHAATAAVRGRSWRRTAEQTLAVYRRALDRVSSG